MRKAEGARVDRLGDVLRAGESSDDLVLLLRGARTRVPSSCGRSRSLRRATPTAASVRVGYHSSLRAARSTNWPRSIRSSGYPKYRRVPGARLAEVAVLLPTFQAPHWAVLFRPPDGARRPEEELLHDLLDILGPVLDNPRYVPDRSRRR
jgi:hypothetical protein